ncbi:MAG: flagellar basal body L-ring protein FlgH [Pseudomonas sp.]
MKVSRLPLALLLTASLCGCYPAYIQSLRMRESLQEYREKRQAKKPMSSTAVQYAPKPAAPVVAAAGGEVGRLLRVEFEEVPPAHATERTGVKKPSGLLDNPLVERLRRGGNGGMSATVIRQLYDGRLLVCGQKPLSGEAAGYVQLDGIVDPRDVDGEGKVLSSRVVEPRLSYSGDSAGRPPEVAELARFFQGGGEL